MYLQHECQGLSLSCFASQSNAHIPVPFHDTNTVPTSIWGGGELPDLVRAVL